VKELSTLHILIMKNYFGSIFMCTLSHTGLVNLLHIWYFYAVVSLKLVTAYHVG
jgi:hypothetical protein